MKPSQRLPLPPQAYSLPSPRLQLLKLPTLESSLRPCLDLRTRRPRNLRTQTSLRSEHSVGTMASPLHLRSPLPHLPGPRLPSPSSDSQLQEPIPTRKLPSLFLETLPHRLRLRSQASAPL